MFMECVNTRPVWLFVRELITDKQPGLLFTPCIDFMNLSYTRLEGENMTLFLLSTFVAFIHECRRNLKTLNFATILTIIVFLPTSAFSIFLSQS